MGLPVTIGMNYSVVSCTEVLGGNMNILQKKFFVDEELKF